MKPSVWTVGHSNHEFDRLAELLTGERVEFVVDVRSYPYSSFAPQFGREELEPALRRSGIRYLYLGDALGGRPACEDQYDEDGHALYDSMAREPAFDEAIERILRGAAEHRIALLCSEGKPDECHRRLLVGRVLTQRGAELRHILPDGTVRAEAAVPLSDGHAQESIFDDERPPQWRSTRSVSRRRRLSTSSVD